MGLKKTRIIVLSMSLTIFIVVLVSMFFIIKAKFHEIEFLTDASWVHYDDNIGEKQDGRQNEDRNAPLIRQNSFHKRSSLYASK